MSLRHEVMLAWAALVVLQVVTLIAAVGLLARTTPAVERIMQDNEPSIAAVESMFAELGRGQADSGALPRFEEALASAREHVTEDGEAEQLGRIEAGYQAAFAGDPTARERTTVALLELTSIHRAALERATARASTLGRTGAWAAAVLGLVSLVGALAMGRRLERRVIEPIEATAAAVKAIEDGDRHRRCPVHGPSEIMTLGRGIEALRQRPTHAVARHDERHDERRLLLALLDAEPGVAILVDERGAILHANVAGTTALLDDAALGLAVRDPRAALPPSFSRQPLGEGAMVVRGPADAYETALDQPRPFDSAGSSW